MHRFLGHMWNSGILIYLVFRNATPFNSRSISRGESDRLTLFSIYRFHVVSYRVSSENFDSLLDSESIQACY
jgi:hypothetical protein